MTSSRDDESENKALALLGQIRSGLADKSGSAEERLEKMHGLLNKVADLLVLYGANVFTLAMHQVHLMNSVADIESAIASTAKSKTVPPLPAARPKVSHDDNN